jgi:hypothetical protein
MLPYQPHASSMISESCNFEMMPFQEFRTQSLSARGTDLACEETAPRIVWGWVPILVPADVAQSWGYSQTGYHEIHGGEYSSAHAEPTDFTCPLNTGCSEEEDSTKQCKFASEITLSQQANYGQQDAQEQEEEEQDISEAASCQATAGTPDFHSDASTDVGDVDDLPDDCEEEVEVAAYAMEASSSKTVEVAAYAMEARSSKDVKVAVHTMEAPSRPNLFVRLSRKQRVEQLRRVIDEFSSLDFSSVDASSQGGLVLRMLTILKSLFESASFYEDERRHEEKRFCLLGLSSADEAALAVVVSRAEALCEERSFRLAFDALKSVDPLLFRKPAMNDEEIEAMNLRRQTKRQRHRQERRERRSYEKSNNQSGKSIPKHTSNAKSSSSASSWLIHQDVSGKGHLK